VNKIIPFIFIVITLTRTTDKSTSENVRIRRRTLKCPIITTYFIKWLITFLIEKKETKKFKLKYPQVCQDKRPPCDEV
jgi:hypothetical protein